MSLGQSTPALPVSLFDLLSNSLVLAQLSPYLRVSSLLALAATSKSFSSLVYGSPYSFRYLDLSVLKDGLSAQDIAIRDRLIRGHTSTNQTADDYHSRALAWIFDSLKKRNVLKDIKTLILDGLSVPGPLLSEILCNESYNVRILSIRGCDCLSDQTLLQTLKYIIRPSRPEGTPKLRGLYYFGLTDRVRDKRALVQRRVSRVTNGVTSSPGAQLGMQLNQRSHNELISGLNWKSHDWYASSGQILSPRFEEEWIQMLQACSGIIAFDAVLCRHDRKSYGTPHIASISLGAGGCENCHSSPERPAFAGESPVDQLPLLAPPPLRSFSVRAAQKPAIGISFTPPFFARCRVCLDGRWCERCNVWWCENCYSVPKVQTHAVGPREGEASAGGNGSGGIKVHLGLCVQGCLMEEMYHGIGEGGMWG